MTHFPRDIINLKMRIESQGNKSHILRLYALYIFGFVFVIAFDIV